MLASSTALAPVTGVVAQDVETPEDASRSNIIPEITDEIVVRGTNIPDPQRATAQVSTFLSADDLARTGDENAALALTRLSGLSIVSGRFAFVRGLGDRYSSALLNGSPLPSPEPLRRTVPLDLFPSNVLNGASVQKTFSAGYPAEFGGGIINLETIRDPGEPYLNVKAGIGFNPVTTARDGIFVFGGDLDFLGFDDGTRSIPGPLAEVLASDQTVNDLDPAQREIVGESLTNAPLSVLQEGTLGPNYDLAIDGGVSVDRGDMTIGFVGVMGFDSEWETQRAKRQIVAGNVLGNDFDLTETSLNTTVNGLGSFSLGWDAHEVAATLFYVHSTKKEAQTVEGLDFNRQGSTGQVFDESSLFLERQLAMAQLAGDHEFGDLSVSWRGAAARSRRDSPYERTLNRQVEPDGRVLFSVPNSYNIRFSELKDDLISAGVDLDYFVPLSGPRTLDFSAGYAFLDNQRNYDFTALRFFNNAIPLDVQEARPDFLFGPDNIDPQRFVLAEIVTPNDSYQGDLVVHAGYFEIDAELIPTVRTTVGVRYEESEQTVQTFDRFGNVPVNDLGFANLDEDYFLPTAAITWNAVDDLQLRLAYSQTITRPQFRELAQSNFFDPDTERSYRGNRNLLNSELENFDARVEYYLGRNQFVTVAGFYKDIENPIEEIQFDTSTFEFEATFVNSPSAELFGGEFEYRTRFAMPFENEWFAKRDWLFSVNYTYTNATVNAEDTDLVFNPVTNNFVEAGNLSLDGARLVGTPEHIVNAQFGWEDDNDQLTILLGWVGDRVLQRGFDSPGAPLPDVIEKPGVQLDVVYRQDINLLGTDMTIGLAGRNLVAADHQEFQISEIGRTEFNTYERGRSLSASLTARF